MVWLMLLPVRPIGVEVPVVTVLFWVAPTEPVTCWGALPYSSFQGLLCVWLAAALWQTCTTSSCVVVSVCELVLPRGMPQVVVLFNWTCVNVMGQLYKFVNRYKHMYFLVSYILVVCLLYSYWTRVWDIPCETSVRSREADLDMEPYWACNKGQL